MSPSNPTGQDINEVQGDPVATCLRLSSRNDRGAGGQPGVITAAVTWDRAPASCVPDLLVWAQIKGAIQAHEKPKALVQENNPASLKREGKSEPQPRCMPLVSVLPPENQGNPGGLWICGGKGRECPGVSNKCGNSQLLGVAEEAAVICLLPERKTHSGGGGGGSA